jgi:hypothetical protein
MKPSTFLKLAAPLGHAQARQEMKDYIEAGGAIGAPFLVINVPESGTPEVTGHEGRNRMLAVLAVEGDQPIETHLFFRGEISRARHITPQVADKLRAVLHQENTGKAVKGPLWEDGKIVKGVNTTADVKPGETGRQAAKFGNQLDKNGRPPLLNKKARNNSDPHTLDNLGLAESRQLNELFDKVYNWQWQQKGDDGWTALFKPKSKVAYNSILVEFNPVSKGSPNYEVNFNSPISGVKKLGGGDEFATFSTVIAIIEAFMSENTSAESLQFYAKREGRALQSRDIKNNRAELYKKMLGRFAKKHNYEFAWNEVGRMTEFILRRDVEVNEDEESHRFTMSKWNQEAGNLYRVITQIERYIDQGQLMRFIKRVDPDKVNAAQSWIDKRWGGDDPVFPDIPEEFWEYPVVADINGEMVIIDGHHRMNDGEDKVLLFPININEAVTETIKKPDPKDTLGVKREDMPQVHADHYPELFKYLGDHGAKMKTGAVPATSLRAVQSEFSDEGVEKMMNNMGGPGTTRKKPLIVSNDNYIIDGHHRWLASYNLEETIPIIKFSLPVAELLDLVRKFPHTTYKDIYTENMSITGTETGQQGKDLEPGTEAWFAHWFTRPHLTRKELEGLKEQTRQFVINRKGVQHEKTSNTRGSSRNTRTNESGR